MHGLALRLRASGASRPGRRGLAHRVAHAPSRASPSQPDDRAARVHGVAALDPAPTRFGDPPLLPTLADVQPETPRQEVILDQMEERIRVRGRIGRELSLPWGTTVREFREMESILEPGESPTASSLGTGEVLLRRADVTVEVRTSLRVDATQSALDVRLQLDVRRDGKDFFHRTWEEAIERRLS